MSKWPTFKSMTFLRLHGGPADQQVLEIAPTMRTLTVAGEQYFRMPDSRSKRYGEYGGAYLWARYWDADQVAERAAGSTPDGER